MYLKNATQHCRQPGSHTATAVSSLDFSRRIPRHLETPSPCGWPGHQGSYQQPHTKQSRCPVSSLLQSCHAVTHDPPPSKPSHRSPLVGAQCPPSSEWPAGFVSALLQHLVAANHQPQVCPTCNRPSEMRPSRPSTGRPLFRYGKSMASMAVFFLSPSPPCSFFQQPSDIQSIYRCLPVRIASHRKLNPQMQMHNLTAVRPQRKQQSDGLGAWSTNATRQVPFSGR